MPQCTEDSSNDGPKGDSVESTHSRTYIPTGKGLAYPPKILTDPDVAANLTISDTRDSVTEGPQISNYVGTIVKTVQLNGPDVSANQNQTGMMTLLIQLDTDRQPT